MSQFFNILLRAGLIAMSGWIIPMAFKQLPISSKSTPASYAATRKMHIEAGMIDAHL
ncbi:hypothetical protein [Methanothrix sp.]|uniref:hypothetical protein n=1 Tax=Methanothrix sp. TaxID=90426 RepID=UPI003C796257